MAKINQSKILLAIWNCIYGETEMGHDNTETITSKYWGVQATQSGKIHIMYAGNKF